MLQGNLVLLTNVAPSYPEVNGFEAATGEEIIDNIVQKYGKENVDENEIPGFKGVWVDKDVLNAAIT